MKITEIKLNPNNPRVIKDDKFEKLKKSIQDFPQMLELRPLVLDENNIVLGGNMRLRALQDLGIDDVPIIYAKDLTGDQKKEFTIKDNLSYGEWDWDTLANEWDMELLDKWGFNEGELKVNYILRDIDDITVDWDSLDLLVVNPPEAPRLKERFELNFENIEKYKIFKDKYRNEPEKLITDLGL